MTTKQRKMEEAALNVAGKEGEPILTEWLVFDFFCAKDRAVELFHKESPDLKRDGVYLGIRCSAEELYMYIQ